MKKWIAFFSKSGSEIAEVSNRLGRWPDLIITNRKSSTGCNPAILERKVVFIKNDPTEIDYTNAINSCWGTDVFITLHGYMRILPKKICETYEIYNGHPGLITKYPELKGKDPQMRAFEGGYDTGGSVIHKVTPGVDEGEVLMEREVGVRLLDLDGLFHILHNTSVNMWIEFLKERL